MKIGIITLSASYNCGSMLQSYALKEALKKYGDVEIINFSSEASHFYYDIVPKTFIAQIKMELHHKGIVKKLKKETAAYIDFQKKFLRITGKEYFTKDLSEIADKYDIIVAGSDQIWNVCMGDFDEAFLCNWTAKKKIAYAPSLGGHDIRESNNSQKLISYIKDFACVSVRESVGKKCLDEILERDIPKVLDPTLIFGNDNWLKIIKKPKIQGEYIFFYSWAYCYEELRDIVSSRAKETGLPVYVIDAHKWRTHNYKEDSFILYEEAGPLAFLSLMANAKECFVESFHGMLFAYMFKKDFWLLDTHEDYNALDARLKELVELVGAKNRIVTKFNKTSIDFNQEFPYKKNDYLESMQNVSWNYLDKAFEQV